MCLGVPGQVTSVTENAQGMAMGAVSFAGVSKEVCLAYVPEAKAGDYVIVHAGFAISVVSEDEARQTLELLRELEEAGGTPPGTPGPAPGGTGS